MAGQDHLALCGLMMMCCADADAGWAFVLVGACLLGGFYTRAGLGLDCVESVCAELLLCWLYYCRCDGSCGHVAQARCTHIWSYRYARECRSLATRQGSSFPPRV